MLGKFVLLVITIGMVNAFCAKDTHGFGSNYTHPVITRMALENISRMGRIDRYMIEDLEIEKGLDSSFKFYHQIDNDMPDEEIERNNDVPGKNMKRKYATRFNESYTGRYLTISGSEAEDHPTERAQHHFLDPVSDQGLNNNYYGVGTVADFAALFYPPAEQGNVGRFLCSLVSLCEPSFNLDGTSAVDRLQGRTSDAYPRNYFAWTDTRKYFYKALTSRTREERDHYHAMTFFSLGHSLHLLEDMGVPAHTRNDFIYDHIWHGLIKGSYLEGYLESGRMVENMERNYSIPSFPGPADFWDNNNSLNLPGLAEYTNYNFLSEGTVFKDYNHPEWISVSQYETIAEDGKTDLVQYYTGMTSDNIVVSHLAAVGLLHSAFGFLDAKGNAQRTAYLDTDCYKDYAEIIIPKVSSYVSGLFEYFFRGRIAVIKDGRDGLRIKNMSAESMNGGIIEIYYDSAGGNRARLASYEMTQNTPLMPGEIMERIAFNPPTDNMTPGRYIVAFKGRLGKEDDAVIGKIFTEKIYFVSDRRGAPEIYAMNSDGTDIRILTANDNPDISYSHPVVSSDGTVFAFSSNLDGADAIWMGDVNTGDIRKMVEGIWPSWSPDGKKLAYYRNVSGKNDIFIMDTTTLEETRITGDSYNNLWPSWSPDGSKIVYTSQRDGKSDIIVIGLASRTEQNLTAVIDNLDRWKPVWSPDGKRIAYEKPTKIVYGPGEPFFVNIHVLDLETGVETDLTRTGYGENETGVWNGTPAWIDNTSIVIESNVSGEPWSDLWVIDAGGNGFVRRLTDTPGHDGYPFIW